MFFDHLGWAEGKEVSENRLYEGISEILKKYLCPVRDSENATSLAITATSMFGLVITLLPPRWVHNIYSECATTLPSFTLRNVLLTALLPLSAIQLVPNLS